ncbi:hypothetical protein [Nonomuraea guangzhouensis]|uniref:Uncharacterized protein n=1 Tax=Nonomuraea guangzhouensis TaxID=1291555 RepID=A0ABW4GZD3_9ACTN|nr:hypothetical protein [Nonomuraea guangzhouensis]
MSIEHEDQEERAAEFYGLRPSNARVCPRVVAGKRCLANSGECVCFNHQHVLDHGRVWLDKGGKHVLTGEPYSATGDEIAALVGDVAALGLKVSLSGRSLWNPRSTLLIRVTAHGNSTGRTAKEAS